MTLVVDPWHWLEADGSLPTADLRLRKRVLRIARFIEYGAALKLGESRGTLIECPRRPKGAACLGLLRVLKAEVDAIDAHCPVCKIHEARVHNWQRTLWARGMMPLPVDGALH